MDEFDAVQWLLAERPPPKSDVVSAARASLEQAVVAPPRGPVPLHRSGGRRVLGPPPAARRRWRRWRGWLAPLAAAAAVAAVVAVSLAVSSTVGLNRARARVPATGTPAAFAKVPPYFVTLTGEAVAVEGHRAEVVATATGKVLGSVTAPKPYTVFTEVAAAGDDRTFVLAAQRGKSVAYVNGGHRPLMFFGVGPAKLYKLTVGRSGRPGALEPLPVPPVTGSINGFALSPDGSKLAVSLMPTEPLRSGRSQPPRNAKLMVASVATGASRGWVLSGTGSIGQNKPTAESLAWASDNRTLLFRVNVGNGGARAEMRLLDTTAPSGSLVAASKRVPFTSALISGQVEDPVQAYGTMLLTTGTRVITVVSTDTFDGHPGFPPQERFAAQVRKLLPSQCRGTDHYVAKKTPYCANQVKLALKRLAGANKREQARTGTDLAFTEFSAATAKAVAVLGRLHGEGQGNTWADVSWVSPAGTAMIIDGSWPVNGGSWPTSQGAPVSVAGVMTGGTFTPFPQRVQALLDRGQPTW
jgi:hypothetical protein